jgi:hypothetical protein
MRLRTLLALFAAIPLANIAHAATRTVALTGQQAPGAPAGANFTALTALPLTPTAPVLNNAGRAAFGGEASVSGGASYSGAWTDAPGALALIARSGGQAPGTSAGTTFADLSDPLLNDAGREAFSAVLNGPAAQNFGIWADDDAGLALVARKGSAAPGATGINFGQLFPPSLSDGGSVAFRAQVTGTGVTAENNVGIWAQRAAGLTLMARAGSQAPGAPAGAVFDNFPATDIAINQAGQIAFKGFIEGTEVTPTTRMGIWAERSDDLALIVRQGDAVPGVAGGVFDFIDDPSLNRNGQIAFTAIMSGVSGPTNRGVFTDAGGAIALVARRGTTAPGGPTGRTFSTFGNVMVNGEGQVAFAATLSGTGVNTSNDGSLWSTSSGSLQLAAREGAFAPGSAAGQVFNSFVDPVLNSAGQLAFAATLTGTGITAANDRGIWAQGLDGSLRLVAREGDALEVAPGVTRTLSDVYLAGGFNTEDGRRVGFNDYGEVAFLAKFTDGSSGIFVSDVAKALSGDFDGDSDVDGADFLTWQRGLGRTGTGLPSNGDANADGNVNAADLAVWKTEFGAAPAEVAVAAIPEPGGAMLALLGCACLLWRRAR